MPRPYCHRRVTTQPSTSFFKPVGIPVFQLQEVVISLDELEAIRLADLDGLYQEESAKKMAISRTTFSRIIDSAHRKIADAIVNGKALRIEGGPIDFVGRRCCRNGNRG
jgi:uncharacterized protein